MFLCNIRSLLPKFDDLCVSVANFCPGIVMITESWLAKNIDDCMLHIPHYNLYRHDRDARRGGGVCMWVRDVISSSLYPLSTPCPSSCNILFVNLSCSKREILCCLAYIPPGLCCEERHNIADFFVREMDAALVSNPDKSIIIAGDFNDFCTRFFKEDFALSEMVKSPTRLNACLDRRLPSRFFIRLGHCWSAYTNIRSQYSSLEIFEEYFR